jgi:hypothetical protein
MFEIKSLPQNPTVTQQLKVKRMRARLVKQIKDFIQASASFLPNLEESELNALEDESIDTPADEFVEPEDTVEVSLEEYGFNEEEDEAEASSIYPESIILPLPSNVTSVSNRPALKSLISVERELRKGQANDALEGVRIGLANKSLLLLTDVNQSNSTKQTTRAWASVRNAQSQILLHARGYQRAWKALQSIGAKNDLLLYQKLEEKHLVVVKDITNAKRYGQGSETLAWFWRIGPTKDSASGEWMEECECNRHLSFSPFKFISLVYRVNWLKAKARVDRWLEEEILVKHEMQWTTLWFKNQANLWRDRSKRADLNLPPGHKSYAAKQHKLWNTFYGKALDRFSLHI